MEKARDKDQVLHVIVNKHNTSACIVLLKDKTLFTRLLHSCDHKKKKKQTKKNVNATVIIHFRITAVI